ncbi:MAG TPA: CHAD domain-containing protein [Polyangiaceae bacterium]|jgi:CHAD domain-containing protein
MRRGPAIAAAAPMAGPFLAAKLHALDDRLKDVAPRVTGTTVDAAAVHDLRVALRRTRTLLEVGAPLLGRFRADEVRRSLRGVMRATGALRDDEVLLELLGSLGVERPDVRAWLEVRSKREQRLRHALVRHVEAGELDRGRALLEALLAFRVNPRRDRRLAKYARRALDRARRDVDRRKAARPDDPAALHRLRIAYKRVRYTAETFAEALPREAPAIASRAARMQARLGDLHDVDVAIACVRRARSLPPDARAELCEALAHARGARLAGYLRELGPVSAAPLLQLAGSDSLRKISTR